MQKEGGKQMDEEGISQINVKMPKSIKMRFAQKCLTDGVKMGPKMLELLECYLGDVQCSTVDQ